MSGADFLGNWRKEMRRLKELINDGLWLMKRDASTG